MNISQLVWFQDLERAFAVWHVVVLLLAHHNTLPRISYLQDHSAWVEVIIDIQPHTILVCHWSYVENLNLKHYIFSALPLIPWRNSCRPTWSGVCWTITELSTSCSRPPKWAIWGRRNKIAIKLTHLYNSRYNIILKIFIIFFQRPLFQELFQGMNFAPEQPSLDRVMEGNYAFLAWRTYFRNIIIRDYTDSRGEAKVKKSVFSLSLHCF